jgi:hypothetical protein
MGVMGVGSSCSPGKQHPGVTTTTQARRKYSGVTEVIYFESFFTHRYQTSKINHGSETVNMLKILNYIHVKAVPRFIYFSPNSNIIYNRNNLYNITLYNAT